MLKFNEGKACDAVIRRIEQRDGALRRNSSMPEREGHSAPIKFACEIGGRLYAFEHTGIEPFDGYMRMQADADVHFRPLTAALSVVLPTSEHFQLQIPVKATQGLKGRDIRRIHLAIVEWAKTTAPTLSIAPYGRYAPFVPATIPGVPFKVVLHRFTSMGVPGHHVSVIHSVEGDLEVARATRIARSCATKFPKLAAWRRDHGARTVLILEDNDIQLTNPERVAQVMVEAEATRDDRPDEVYVVGTMIDELWYVWAIRIDEVGYYDLCRAGRCMTEVDPVGLTDVTNR